MKCPGAHKSRLNYFLAGQREIIYIANDGLTVYLDKLCDSRVRITGQGCAYQG